MNARPSSARPLDALLLFALFHVLYGVTAVDHLIGGDMGVFATIHATGGYAFPPGYPLYSMILAATAWLPFGPPAHSAALVAATFGAASVALLYLAAARWDATRGGAAFGAIAFGVSAYVWFAHTQPEVFALNHLFAAGLLWLCAPNPPELGVLSATPRRRVALLGLVAGLALSHHHTIVFLTPVGLWAVWRALRDHDESGKSGKSGKHSQWSRKAADLAAGAAAMAVGLLLYGYLWLVSSRHEVQAESAWHWGEVEGFGDLLHIFLRRDYGTFSLTHTDADSAAGALDQLIFLARSVPADMLYLPALLGVAGVGWALWRALVRREPGADAPPDPPPGRWPLLWLVASLLLAGPVFVSLIGRAPEGIDYLHIRKFHLLFQLLLALFAALAAGRLLARLSRPALQLVVLVALLAAGTAAALPFLSTHQQPTVEQYLRDTVDALPDEAVLVGTGDHHFFGTLYLQRALDHRSDVTYVDATLLAHRWYNRRTGRRLGTDLPYRGTSIDTDRLIRAVHATGRPLFVTHPFHPTLLQNWPSAPWGTAIRVYPRSTRPPTPDTLFRRNLALLEDFSVQPVPDAPPTSWARFVLDDYAGTWRSLAAALRATGHPEAAARATEIAGRFAPWRTATGTDGR